MIAQMKKFYNDIARKKAYWMPIILLAVLAYGFAITNRTVSIDDLAYEHFVGDGMAMLSATRWGMVLWMRLFSASFFTPFVNRFLSVCFLILGASILGCCGYTIFQNKNVWPYTLFTAVYVTFPLINEIYEYDGANMIVGGNLVLVALCLLFQICHKGSNNWKKILLSSILLTPVVSSYEAGAFVYVAAVCIYLFCKYAILGEKSKRAKWLREGLCFAIPLVLAVVWRIAIGLLLIKIFNLTYHSNGATQIQWSSNVTIQKIILQIKESVAEYVLYGFLYPPLMEFVISAILFFAGIITISIKRRSLLPSVLGMIVLFSLFAQGILQGAIMPYRTAQTLNVFVAFVAAMTIAACVRARQKGIRVGAVVISLWLCMHQSIYLSQILSLNNQRSDNEATVAQQIGMRLMTEYEEKPVVFVGAYNLGRWITMQSNADSDTIGGRLYEASWRILGDEVSADDIRVIQTNINSVLNYSERVLYGQKLMGDYFSYFGYDIDVFDSMTDEQFDKYTRVAIQEGMRPFEIRDMGDYLLACLGELELPEE